MITFETPEEPSRALRIARRRGILPTTLDSEGIRRLSRLIRANAIFSARTNQAAYLQKIRDVIARITAGDIGMGQARVILRATLDAMGYTPEGGFPGDDARQIPPADAETIRDLRSNARLDLIVSTQEALARNAAMLERGLEPGRINAFPGWELYRIGDREAPREWLQRWQKADGPPPGTDRRMIARKDDLEFWRRLGSTALFDDALDTLHPPFAFYSGMGWREIDREEMTARGLVTDAESLTRPDDAELNEILPAPSASVSGLSRDLIEELAADLDAIEEGERLKPRT